MQALQRVHRSRSIGLLRVQVASKAPSQPVTAATAPAWTAKPRSWGSVPPAVGSSTLTSRPSPSICAARTARSAAPMTSTLPPDLYETSGHRLGRRQLRRRDQCGDLRQRGRTVLRPARRFADVDEADRPLDQARRAFGGLAQLEEEAALLRAGDEKVVGALGGALERAGLAPAQGRVDRRQARRRPQARGPGRSAGPSSVIVLLQSQISVVIGAGFGFAGRQIRPRG